MTLVLSWPAAHYAKANILQVSFLFSTSIFQNMKAFNPCCWADVTFRQDVIVLRQSRSLIIIIIVLNNHQGHMLLICNSTIYGSVAVQQCVAVCSVAVCGGRLSKSFRLRFQKCSPVLISHWKRKGPLAAGRIFQASILSSNMCHRAWSALFNFQRKCF